MLMHFQASSGGRYAAVLTKRETDHVVRGFAKNKRSSVGSQCVLFAHFVRNSSFFKPRKDGMSSFFLHSF